MPRPELLQACSPVVGCGCVQVHPVDHPALLTMSPPCWVQPEALPARVMVPKVESLFLRSDRRVTALEAAGAAHVPLHVLIDLRWLCITPLTLQPIPGCSHSALG